MAIVPSGSPDPNSSSESPQSTPSRSSASTPHENDSASRQGPEPTSRRRPNNSRLATTPATLHSRPTSRSRHRTMQVCVNCRDRHVKCDHRQPCSACKELKKPFKCVYVSTLAELTHVERRRVHKRRRKTATCKSCRNKKRKCSRDQPECKECSFDGLICLYDPYPRKEENESGSHTGSPESMDLPSTDIEPTENGDSSGESLPTTSHRPATHQEQTSHEVQDFRDAPVLANSFPGQQDAERTQSQMLYIPHQPTLQRSYVLPALPHCPTEFNPLATPFLSSSQYPTSDLRYQGQRGPPGGPIPQILFPPRHQPQQQGVGSSPQLQGSQDFPGDQHYAGGKYEVGGHAIRQGNVRNAGWPQSVFLPWPHRAQTQNSPLPPLSQVTDPHATAQGQRHRQWQFQIQQQPQHPISAVRNERPQGLPSRDSGEWQDSVRQEERERWEDYQFALQSQIYHQRTNAALPGYRTTYQDQALPAYPTSLYTGPQQLLTDRNTMSETNRRHPARSQRPAQLQVDQAPPSTVQHGRSSARTRSQTQQQQPCSARVNDEDGDGLVPSTSHRPTSQHGGNQDPDVDSKYDPTYYFAQHGRPPAKR